jgi:ABC-2 type transport system ATP-binding protein
MEEAEYLADRVAVIAGGRIVEEGTPETLGGRAQAEAEIRFRLPAGTEFSEMPAEVQQAIAGRNGQQVLLRAASAGALLGPLVRWAEDRRIDLPDLDVRRPSLEDMYLALTTPTEDDRAHG